MIDKTLITRIDDARIRHTLQYKIQLLDYNKKPTERVILSRFVGKDLPRC